MKRLVVLGLGSFFLLTGCFDVEMDLVLNEDLSGTVGLSMTMDMEPMVYMMTVMQRAFSGEEGPPTKEELEAARQEMLADFEGKEEVSEEEMRREAAENLPEGFALRDAHVSQEGLKTSMYFLLDFPHINRLHELELSEPGAGEPGGAPGAPAGEDFRSLSEPFAGLRFVDEGDTYLLEGEAPNPVEDMGESEMEMPGMEGMLEGAFKDLRIAWTIEVPGEIVEHNAMRVEGRKLIWEFTIENLTEGTAADIGKIMVRFKK